MAWDGLYYYYKPEYLDWVADSYTCDEEWVPVETGHLKKIDFLHFFGNHLFK